MDATQMISDSILESDEEDNEEETENERGRPLAKLCILKNKHIPETEFPLFLGDNVLGRDPNTCTLPLPASSVSKQHATICLSVYRRHGCHSEVDMEALVWDLGSMNGTRKGHLKLTPNVRYALSEGDSLVVADIPCQFVSCGVDSSQGDPRTPVNRNSGVKARLPDASGEKGDDTSTDSKKCVNGGTKTMVPLKETPVRASCLTFEQTPHQPQGTLVPESDSDSDNESGGRGEGRPKALVSDSDSHKSSPSCSSFLSPTNKIIPESEDESPITPSSSTKNKTYRHGSFSTEEVDVGRQQLEKKKAVAFVEDSEEEEEREEQVGTKSTEEGQHVPVKKESSVSLTGDDRLSTPAVSTDAIPAFNRDSDTDVEGEEEGAAAAGPVTLNTNQQVDQPPNKVQFHMDSDTDIDEDDDASGKAPETLPSPDENTKPPHVVSVIQPEGITMDSDTDVDDDAVVSDAATKAEPTIFQSAHTADSASSVQPEDFNLDSDTDVDEKEEEEEGETRNKSSKTPNKLDVKLTAPKSALVDPDSLHLESDTDDESIPAPATSEPSLVAAVAESRTTADADADLDILSDSDTDVEDESPLVIPVAVTTLSVSLGTTSQSFQADSDADTDMDESSVRPAGDGAGPADLRVDGDTEDKKSDIGEAGEDQIPSLHRESTPGLLPPLLQNCSTPVQMSEEEVEDMETQAFTSPSSAAFRRVAVSAVRPVVLSPCSDRQEDEDFVMAKTQPFAFQSRDHQSSEEPTQAFVLEFSTDNKNDQSTRGDSFQLGLSDSSHLQCPERALAMESTQAFFSVEGGVNLEDTQTYAAISATDRPSAENDSNLEATQDYGEDEETDRCSIVSEKEGQVDLALEATQAYISEPHNVPEDDTDEDEKQNMATSETRPSKFSTSSTLAMAETLPMLPSAGEECLAPENPVCSVQIQPRPQMENGGKGAQPQEKHLSDTKPVSDTQPMCTSDDEDSFPGPRKRTAKPLPLEEEQTQDLTCSELSLSETQPMHDGVGETQPMATCEDDDDKDSMPGPRKRKAKQLHLEDEETQQLTNSDLSAAETQPMGTCEDDDEDSMPGPRKRKAMQLQPEEESQPLASFEVSAGKTQPLGTREGEQSDEEDVIACPRKRKAKPLQLEEELTQPLTSTDVETLAVVTSRSEEGDDEDSIPGPRKKRKAKQMKLEEEDTQPLDNFDVTPVETQLLKTKTGLSSLDESEAGTGGACVQNLRETRAKLGEGEEQAECSTPFKRQTRGRRGKPLSDDDNSKEEVKQAKQARGKKLMKQQKHDGDEEDKILGRERNKHAVNKSPIKEQEERNGREEKDAAEFRHEREKNDEERKVTDERERERDEMERQHRRKEEDKLENERRVNEEEERLHAENAERADKERAERERTKQEQQARLEREEKEEREKLGKEKEAKEKQLKELQEKKEEEDKSKTPARGRRAARRTIASQCTTEPEQDSTVSTNDDFPARRTRSRSNSSNSVRSERSASSVNTQESKCRGRGRGAKRTSEPPQTPIVRNSHRRITVAAGTTEQESNPSNSLSSEISRCSLSSQNRGRGGRQRGRGKKTEHDPDSIPSISQSQSDQNSTSKLTARGRKSKKAEESSNEALHEDEKEKNSQQVTATRGQRQASAVTDEEDQPKQAEASTSEESLLPKRNVRGRGQRAVKSETVERPVASTVSDGDEANDKRKARSELEANTGANFSHSKGKEKSPKTEAAEEEGRDERKDEILASLQEKKRGRASTTQAKKNAKEVEKRESEKMEVKTFEKKVRGRQSVVSRKKKEELEKSGTSLTAMNQDANMEASEQPQTPTSNVSRKRHAPADSSPVAKTPRSSSASPAASGRLRAASQTYKVLFTGVVDEAGEKVLVRLGGSMAKGVADMNCLVTDKVRRTVKFLCALAKGVPIVTTDWLEKSGKAGSFLSPTAFIVKDPEQEKKFNFSLHESLRIASSQPLLQGYEIHVTKSVKPEPVHMKDIISSSGATFLPKMPSSNKTHTVVISCEEDWPLCRPALSASLPVVTAEFILTGILQQKLDFQSHTLSPSTANLQSAGGRGRGRRKT